MKHITGTTLGIASCVVLLVATAGSRGRSDLASFILGSTAHKVIHLTDRPVLIVR